MPLFQRRHYEFLVEELMPHVKWPDKIHIIAKKLQEDNPKFNYNAFVSKGTQSWEESNNIEEPEIDDEIPHLRVS